MEKITKNMVKSAIKVLKLEIMETKECAEMDDNPLYGKYIAEAKSALETLNCVIECGFPMTSKKVKAIVEKYRRF